MAQATYAGHRLTRRVKLDSEESILRADNAFRLAPLGIWAFGILTITESRLIWTPMPYPWDIFPWQVAKTDIRAVSTKRTGVWFFPARWFVCLEATKQERHFNFGGLLSKDQEAKVEDWAAEVREWIASSP